MNQNKNKGRYDVTEIVDFTTDHQRTIYSLVHQVDQMNAKMGDISNSSESPGGTVFNIGSLRLRRADAEKFFQDQGIEVSVDVEKFDLTIPILIEDDILDDSLRAQHDRVQSPVHGMPENAPLLHDLIRRIAIVNDERRALNIRLWIGLAISLASILSLAGAVVVGSVGSLVVSGALFVGAFVFGCVAFVYIVCDGVKQ